MCLAQVPLDERFSRLLNPGYGYAIEEQGRKSTLPGFLTAGLLRQHLGLAGSYSKYISIRPNTTTNRLHLI